MTPTWAKLAMALGLVIAGIGGLVVADTPQAAIAWQRGLFLATLLVQLLALVASASARRGFEPGDPGRTTWSLIVAFLFVRLLAETRLATLYFEVLPDFITASVRLHFVYLSVLRYLYTVGDLLFAVAVVTTIRSFRATGLGFSLRASDWVLMAVVAAMPVTAFVLREDFGIAALRGDTTILAYRLTAITLGAVVAILCIVVYRYVRQMQGGAVSRVWGAMVLAGIARALSFLALAVVAGTSPSTGEVVEQLALWVFACSWWLAALQQRKILR